jgi:hypothetical protein
VVQDPGPWGAGCPSPVANVHKNQFSLITSYNTSYGEKAWVRSTAFLFRRLGIEPARTVKVRLAYQMFSTLDRCRDAGYRAGQNP